MTTVVFLSGKTMGDALGSAGRSLQRNFDRLGHDFLEINFSNPEAMQLLDRALKTTKVEFVLSFVGLGADLSGTTGDGKEVNLWKGMGIPFISLYGDSPAYFFDRHVLPHGPLAALYAFPEHLELRRRLPNMTGLTGLAVHGPLDSVAKTSIDFGRKESGKLVFLKNGNSPNGLLTAWRESLAESMFIMLTDMANELIQGMTSNNLLDIDTLVCTRFRERGLEVEALTNLRLFFIAQLDDYLRRLKSTLIAEALLDFPVEIHGFNWDHVDFTGRRATLVPSADYTASGQLIRESLGIIDMSPNTSKAPHDRPMRALGMHTLCLTNEQQYFKENFEHFEAFSFRFEKDSVQSRVAEVLAHPKRSVEIGAHSAEEFRKKHGQDGIARFMLDTAASLKLDCAPRFESLPSYFVWPATKVY